MAQKGFTLRVDSNRNLSDSLDAVKFEKDPFMNKLVRMMTTRCMMQAVYFCSGTIPEPEFVHYGLAMDIYTHFTSPIRRYADVIVHRLLAASIGADATYPDLVSKEAATRLCDSNPPSYPFPSFSWTLSIPLFPFPDLNRRNRMAQRASRGSIDLYTVLFFKDKVIQEDARVIRIMDNGFLVLVPRYGVEGFITVGEPGEVPHLRLQTADNSLVSADGRTTLRIFDPVVVQIRVEGGGTQRQQVKFSLVRPAVSGLSMAPLSEEELRHLKVRQLELEGVKRRKEKENIKASTKETATEGIVKYDNPELEAMEMMNKPTGGEPARKKLKADKDHPQKELPRKKEAEGSNEEEEDQDPSDQQKKKTKKNKDQEKKKKDKKEKEKTQ